MNGFTAKGFSRLAGVVREIRDFTGDLAFVAGGTDLINTLRRGEVVCDRLIDLSQVRDLDYIVEKADGVHIGAGVTFARIAASEIIRRQARCLAQAAERVGSVQIRNRATIGGNLAGGSPAADSFPPLAALAASIRTIHRHGAREIPAAGLCSGVGVAGLLSNELIVEIVLPPAPSGSASAFGKVGSRRFVSIARLNMAMVVPADCFTAGLAGGRMALGTLGAAPLILELGRLFPEPTVVDAAFAARLAELTAQAVCEQIGARESCSYKMSAAKGLTWDILHDLYGDRIDKGGEGR